MLAYGQSKLANTLHANELTRRLKEEGIQITANLLHPGVIATNLLRHHGVIAGLLGWVRYFIRTIPRGAATTCYVALHPEVEGVSGMYFSDNNIGQPTELSADAGLAKKLRDFSFKMTNPS